MGSAARWRGYEVEFSAGRTELVGGRRSGVDLPHAVFVGACDAVAAANRTRRRRGVSPGSSTRIAARVARKMDACCGERRTSFQHISSYLDCVRLEPAEKARIFLSVLSSHRMDCGAARSAGRDGWNTGAELRSHVGVERISDGSAHAGAAPGADPYRVVDRAHIGGAGKREPEDSRAAPRARRAISAGI